MVGGLEREQAFLAEIHALNDAGLADRHCSYVLARDESGQSKVWSLSLTRRDSRLIGRMSPSSWGRYEAITGFEIASMSNPQEPVRWLEDAEFIASRSLIRAWEIDLRGKARQLGSDLVERQLWTIHYGD